MSDSLKNVRFLRRIKQLPLDGVEHNQRADAAALNSRAKPCGRQLQASSNS